MRRSAREFKKPDVFTFPSEDVDQTGADETDEEDAVGSSQSVGKRSVIKKIANTTVVRNVSSDVGGEHLLGKYVAAFISLAQCAVMTLDLNCRCGRIEP
jgi:hypothetical protein